MPQILFLISIAFGWVAIWIDNGAWSFVSLIIMIGLIWLAMREDDFEAGL